MESAIFLIFVEPMDRGGGRRGRAEEGHANPPAVLATVTWCYITFCFLKTPKYQKDCIFHVHYFSERERERERDLYRSLFRTHSIFRTQRTLSLSLSCSLLFSLLLSLSSLLSRSNFLLLSISLSLLLSQERGRAREREERTKVHRQKRRASPRPRSIVRELRVREAVCLVWCVVGVLVLRGHVRPRRESNDTRSLGAEVHDL